MTDEEIVKALKDYIASTPMNKKKKIETSKLIILVSYIISITLTLLVVIGAIVGWDMEYVAQIALISYGEVTASNIWYYKKATRENIFKNLPEECLKNLDINEVV